MSSSDRWQEATDAINDFADAMGGNGRVVRWPPRSQILCLNHDTVTEMEPAPLKFEMHCPRDDCDGKLGRSELDEMGLE